MSNVAVAPSAPVAPVKPSIKLYTTEELKKYYDKQMDQKFQKRKEDIQIVNGCEVYYKPTFFTLKFNVDGPLVDDVLVDVIDLNSSKVMCQAYPWEVQYTIEKGYTLPLGPGDTTPKFESLGTFKMAAQEFCKTFEKFDDAD